MPKPIIYLLLLITIGACSQKKTFKTLYEAYMDSNKDEIICSDYQKAIYNSCQKGDAEYNPLSYGYKLVVELKDTSEDKKLLIDLLNNNNYTLSHLKIAKDLGQEKLFKERYSTILSLIQQQKLDFFHKISDSMLSSIDDANKKIILMYAGKIIQDANKKKLISNSCPINQDKKLLENIILLQNQPEYLFITTNFGGVMGDFQIIHSDYASFSITVRNDSKPTYMLVIFMNLDDINIKKLDEPLLNNIDCLQVQYYNLIPSPA